MNVIVYICLCVLVSSAVANNHYNEGCGNTFRSLKSSGPVFKVVGGIIAQPNAWPWQISLQVNGQHYCGGSLISDQWILTASHCFFVETKKGGPIYSLGPKQLTVKVGVFSLATTGTYHPVENIYVHPQYRYPIYNDIGLIKLKTRITWNAKRQPICLPNAANGRKNVDVAGTPMTVTGWGATRSYGQLSDKLMEANVNILDANTCRYQYGQFFLRSLLCAASPGKNACQGDSGGPLVKETTDRRDGQTRYYQYGIVHGGGKFCEDPNKAGLYTRVSDYCAWIQQTTGLWLCS